MRFPTITCREVLDVLDDYLDGTLPASVREELELHLALCPACIEYLNTYRDAVRLAVVSGRETAAPEGMPEELVQAILAAQG